MGDVLHIRHDVHVHFEEPTSAGVQAKLDMIIAMITDQGVAMSALSDVVDQILASETAEDEQAAQALAAKDAVIADLQQQLADLGVQLTTAQANDAEDAQTIADTQAALEAQAADVQAQIDRLNEAFPAPVVEPDQGDQG